MYKTKVILFHAVLLEILRSEWGESVSTHGFFFVFFFTISEIWMQTGKTAFKK